MSLLLKRGNDHVVRLTKLRTSASPSVYLNTATVIATLLDSHGHPLFSRTLAYVASSDGAYEGEVPSELLVPVPLSTRYRMRVTAKQGVQNYQQMDDASVIE